MKYFSLDKKHRGLLYLLIAFVFIVLAMSFIYAFISINAKNINIGISVIWWFIYIFILLFFSSFLFSILNSQNILSKNYFVISLGVIGFARISYDNIKSLSLVKEKKKFPKGIHIINKVCYMLLSQDEVLILQLDKPVKIYHFMFFKKYADKIIFSSSNSLNLKSELESKL